MLTSTRLWRLRQRPTTWSSRLRDKSYVYLTFKAKARTTNFALETQAMNRDLTYNSQAARVVVTCYCSAMTQVRESTCIQCSWLRLWSINVYWDQTFCGEGATGKRFSDLPSDQPEAGQIHIQVQNQRDPLADSKPAWEPILWILYSSHSKLTGFVQERPFTVAIIDP